MSELLLFVAIVRFLGAVNALRRPHNERHTMRRPPWLFAMLTSELITIRVIVWAGLLGIGALVGAFDRRAGRAALVLTAITLVLYVVLLWGASRAGRVAGAALDQAGISRGESTRLRWLALLSANPFRVPRRVNRIGGVEYLPGLALDIYRRTDHPADPAPTIVQIHGRGWRGGSRRQQGRPLLHEMALRGWATYPDQIIALKAALAWMRMEGRDHGIDPDRIFITGGSAGGHLAALTALTANRPEYQAGFARADTSVQGAVTFYGIYDFLNRNRTRDHWPVIPLGVMKTLPHDDEARYREASPLDQVHRQAPPFFVIHGTHDSLVSTAESRQFVAALRTASKAPVVYAEIPGATHSFDIVPSLRTQLVVDQIARFLDAIAHDGDA